MAQHITKDQRRKQRTRYKLKQLANGRPRLTVHRTPRHIYAQVIDSDNKTLATVSTVQKDVSSGLKYTGNSEAAAKVGKAIGEAAKKAKITDVVFDRGQFRYHGRVKALADAAREAGLKF